MKDLEQTPELWFHRMGTHYVVAQMYFHLNQLGVLKFIANKSSAKSSEIAAHLNLNENALESALSYLAAVDELITIDKQKEYHFTEFGKAVLNRYKSGEGESQRFNMLDLRVGAFGPIWNSIGGLLSGKAKYGVDVKRDGRFAEEGILKFSHKLVPGLSDVLEKLQLESAVEIGASSGLSEQLAGKHDKTKFNILDRSEDALEEAAKRYGPGADKNKISYLFSDLFEPQRWLNKIGSSKNIALFTIHFHELIAKEQKLAMLINHLKSHTENCYLIAIEQTRIPIEDRNSVSESNWLNSQSHVLMHHFIGYGTILTNTEWVDFFKKNGCHLVLSKPTNFLGFELFVFKI